MKHLRTFAYGQCSLMFIFPVPVGLPDVQDIWVSDLHVFRLSVQEVKEVLDSERRSAECQAPDGPEEFLHK